MRATLLPDPHRGPGYALIQLHGAPPLESPAFLLRRASDGAWLSGSGWRQEETSLSPDGWKSDEEAQRLLLGPGIVDNLDPGESYTLTIPGAGSCALIPGALEQTHIIGGEAVGVTPPPVPGYTPREPGIPGPSPENAINEGVEPTPEILGSDDGDLPSGVAAAPAGVAKPPRKKRLGCALMGVVLVVGWLGAGVALWHGAMRTPAAPTAATETGETAEESSFSLFPRTDPDGEPTYEDEEKPKS